MKTLFHGRFAVVAAAVVFLAIAPSTARAKICMSNALDADWANLVDRFAQTGDCSLLPRITSLNDQLVTQCHQRCGKSCGLGSSEEVLEKSAVGKLRRQFCAGGTANPPAAPTTKAKAPMPVSPDGPLKQSASCSDITGTGNDAPAATDCKDAVADRDVARLNRKKNPELSKYSYKKAAEAARRAGDTKLELSILREATEPPPVEQAAELPCATAKREAAIYIKGAEEIEKTDPSCAGLRQAAENYLTAGKIFFRDVKVGQAREEVENSCAIKLTNEMLQRGDTLNDRVDGLMKEGQCEPGLRIPPPSNGGTAPIVKNNEDEQHKKDCADILLKLAAHSPNPEWLEQQMARSHCKPDGTPMSLREALTYEMQKKGDE